MLYLRDFTQDELEILQKNSKKRSFLGAKCRTLLGAGQQHLYAEKTAKQFKHRPRTVRRWFNNFSTYGVASLWDQRFNQSPRKFTEEQIKALVELAHRKPEELDLPFSSWTYQSLADEAIRKELVGSISATHYRRILKKHDITWKRNKGWLKITDPEYDVKRKERDETIALAEVEGCVVLSLDECGPLRKKNSNVENSTVSPKGQPEKRETDWGEGKRAEKLEVIAAQNVKTKEVHYVVDEHKTHEDLINLLKIILMIYGTLKYIFILMDNNGMHNAGKLQDFLREHSNLFIVRLPKRSPWLNPIERTFRVFKKRCLASRNFKNLEELKKTIEAFWIYYNLTYAKVERKCAQL